jgi:hypothetical protein
VADRIRLTGNPPPALRLSGATWQTAELFYRVCGGIAGAPKHAPFARQKPTKRFLTGVNLQFLLTKNKNLNSIDFRA